MVRRLSKRAEDRTSIDSTSNSLASVQFDIDTHEFATADALGDEGRFAIVVQAGTVRRSSAALIQMAG
jgi:hypothetical protein